MDVLTTPSWLVGGLIVGRWIDLELRELRRRREAEALNRTEHAFREGVGQGYLLRRNGQSRPQSPSTAVFRLPRHLCPRRHRKALAEVVVQTQRLGAFVGWISADALASDEDAPELSVDEVLAEAERIKREAL